MTPLLEVCSAWRDATLDKIYRDVWWCNAEGPGVSCQDWDKHFSAPRSLSRAFDTDNSARVRSVRLHFNGSIMLDDSLFELFDTAPRNNLALSGVSAIEFDFEGAEGAICDSDLFNPDIAQSFCDKINRMFPNARKRDIQSCFDYADYKSHPFVHSLFSGLLANSFKISIFNYELDALSSLSTTYLNLRSLSFFGVTIESPAIELIRRNAETLRDLFVLSEQPAVFSKIVIADDGTPIVYPRVISLMISFNTPDDPNSHSCLSTPAGTPFPSLGKLKCSNEYPFGNDILFRGNTLTLEYLELYLCPRTVQTLESHGIFTPEHLPSLRYAYGIVPWGAAESSPCISAGFFLSLAANASVIKTHGPNISFSSLNMTIEHFGHNITVLDLSSIAFTLHETLELIRQLPHLNKLKTGIVATDELRSTDRSHNDCLGECKIIWEEECRRHYSAEESNTEDDSDSDADGSGNCGFDWYDYNCSGYTYTRTREFFFTHLDVIYGDMDFVEELYRRYYPLSKTLFHLDAGEYSNNLMACCKMIAILCMLCPTIRRVQTHSAGDLWEGDDFFCKDSDIARHEIEETEQHASVTSRLQLSSLSIR